MRTLTPKQYQADVLERIGAYFDACHQRGRASYAFHEVTEEIYGRAIPYNPLQGFDLEMPYFCLRVPTGGGKTFIAAKSVSIINSRLLRVDQSVILWLTPSKAIRDQTVKALRDREHPYHAALLEAGPVTVMELDEAKTITPATLDTSTVVIVCTRQAFQVGNEEIRKVYEENGDLMAHFSSVTPEQRVFLDPLGGAKPLASFMNVLRLRRPFVIVDEAHNSRTELAFDTLAKFRPSGIMELTATPDMERNPSNVLHSVYAGDLKAEEMIKLPVMLETVPDWQRCLALAIDLRDQLDVAARREQAEHNAPYLRPIVLIQAEKRRQGVETRDVDAVKRELMTNQNVPETQIIIATGDERGLEDLAKEFPGGGILSERCPVNFVITQQALAEGWDCPFAYILVSLMELSNATSVEQLLGRILRQPNARRFENQSLNRSYAFVVSRNFSETANTLRDRLVKGAGFERQEAGEFVAARKQEQFHMDSGRLGPRVQVTPVVVPLPESVNIKQLPKDTRSKVSWDAKKQELTIAGVLNDADVAAMEDLAVMEETREQIRKGVEASRKEVKLFSTPAQQGLRFEVPQLQVVVNGELELFNEPEVLDYPWDLPIYQASPTEEQIISLDLHIRVEEAAQVDIDDERGRLRIDFLNSIQRDLGMSYTPEHWDETRLAAWLCRNVRDDSITHDSKRNFISRWLSSLLNHDGMTLARANREKYLLRDMLTTSFAELRRRAIQTAYQTFMFGDGKEARVKVSSDASFLFDNDNYSPTRDYDNRFGPIPMDHHFYDRLGDFDSEEEYLCALEIARHAAGGRIQFWVRNLVNKQRGFFLQTGNGKFFPDFVCKLTSGEILIIEYKGGVYWDGAEENRKIGNLWAELSDGKCRFVMVKDRNWEAISSMLQ